MLYISTADNLNSGCCEMEDIDTISVCSSDKTDRAIHGHEEDEQSLTKSSSSPTSSLPTAIDFTINWENDKPLILSTCCCFISFI